ncbi:TetR/AcrR family transcriptional regulator [Streptomyces sp. NPDC048496]|uniref:TetR/AcrR family transcriptional regulator n=1 Tax=Streptomyces sp. NPDC048496 TaxID=3365558 RepID=UPI00371E6E21
MSIFHPSSEGQQRPRTARTRGRLCEALLAACEEQPLDRVSVSDVVRRAAAGRATFCLDCSDLRPLALDVCAETARQAVDALHAWDDVPPAPRRPDGLVALMEAVRTRAGVYRSLLRAGRSASCCTRSCASAASANSTAAAPGSGEDPIASAVAGLFTGVLADWVHGRIDACPAQPAGRVRRTLLAVHATAASR